MQRWDVNFVVLAQLLRNLFKRPDFFPRHFLLLRSVVLLIDIFIRLNAVRENGQKRDLLPTRQSVQRAATTVREKKNYRKKKKRNKIVDGANWQAACVLCHTKKNVARDRIDTRARHLSTYQSLVALAGGCCGYLLLFSWQLVKMSDKKFTLCTASDRF